ncbi:hypothetical protein B296_00002875 [Ensete ventricosum]|uniref:LysM domain-containing protein n=1 Tax=Ensete ventricosum TaxID=4639 RepID=A0A427B9Z0_ENSVE|nr:hypothetical protein B296_00002875 [Ensete ventricosum]
MATSKAATFYSLAVLLALLLTISLTEGRLSKSRSYCSLVVRKTSSPSCKTVYGVKSGDTCFAVAQVFHLTAFEFSAINPNLDCDKLFVGQWLCITGDA